MQAAQEREESNAASLATLEAHASDLATSVEQLQKEKAMLILGVEDQMKRAEALQQANTEAGDKAAGLEQQVVALQGQLEEQQVQLTQSLDSAREEAAAAQVQVQQLLADLKEVRGCGTGGAMRMNCSYVSAILMYACRVR